VIREGGPAIGQRAVEAGEGEWMAGGGDTVVGPQGWPERGDGGMGGWGDGGMDGWGDEGMRGWGSGGMGGTPVEGQVQGNNMAGTGMPIPRSSVFTVPELHGYGNFSDGNFSDDSSEYFTDDEGGVENNGVKHAYRDETWSQDFFTYDPKPKQFLGRRGTSKFFDHIPTILQLFELFWPFNMLRKIVFETNRYATHSLDALGNTMGGAKWVSTSVAELKAFLAIHMYMGMKRQPNIKTYWEKVGSLFHCPIISSIMSRDRFIRLRRCLHITNPATYEHIEKGDARYDKLR
jgi:hypothetical protein